MAKLKTIQPPIPQKITYYASVTTPSYSLLRMYSRVLRKWFFGASRLEDWVSLVWRLEWMSSIRPLRYFVVTCVFANNGKGEG